MKKLMLVMLLSLFIVMPVFADLSDNISKAIDKYPIKAGVVYNFDIEDWDAIYGITLKEFDFADLALYHDGDEYLALGIDINVPFTAKSTIGIMTGLGVNRIDKFEGEAQGIIGIIGKIRF